MLINISYSSVFHSTSMLPSKVVRINGMGISIVINDFPLCEDMVKKLGTWVEVKTKNDYYIDKEGGEWPIWLIEEVITPNECKHEWVYTQGLLNTWKDCKICGIKGENV